jgi:hypothetical protein
LRINKEWIRKLFPKNSSYFKLKKNEFELSGWKQISRYQYHYMDLAIIEGKEESELFHRLWSAPLKMEFGAIISSETIRNDSYDLHSEIEKVNYYISKKHKQKIKENIFSNSIYIS